MLWAGIWAGGARVTTHSLDWLGAAIDAVSLRVFRGSWPSRLISRCAGRLTEPAAVWLLRHGQSQGNVIRDAAAARDSTCSTSRTATWTCRCPNSDNARPRHSETGCRSSLPTTVPTWSLRRRTCVPSTRHACVLKAAGLDVKVHQDERLRERELGILDLLTHEGVKARFPEEFQRRQRLGKFYHRPPGGESWVDVALRLRSLRDSIGREHSGRRVLLVTHEVVIVLMRYLMEDLDEKEALALGGGRIANCSLTTYITQKDGIPRLELAGWTAPLEDANEPVTEAPDAPVAPR